MHKSLIALMKWSSSHQQTTSRRYSHAPKAWSLSCPAACSARVCIHTHKHTCTPKYTHTHTHLYKLTRKHAHTQRKHMGLSLSPGHIKVNLSHFTDLVEKHIASWVGGGPGDRTVCLDDLVRAGVCCACLCMCVCVCACVCLCVHAYCIHSF